MRIIAGAFKGRRLAPVQGGRTRPTAAKVREALFSVLGAAVSGARVLDLFAGTGALGIEAISRGASGAVFVEEHPGALQGLRRNLADLGLQDRTQVLPMAVTLAVKKLAGQGARFHLAFLDPPYGGSEAAVALNALASLDLLVPGAQVIVEHSRRESLPEASGLLRRTEMRRYGDTQLAFYLKEEPAQQEHKQLMPDIAVYPGSFDPITNGHLDLIQRALRVFDRIIVAVATNAFKKSLFTIEERMEMIRVSLADYPMVTIDTFDGLLVHYARRQNARVIVRGLRAVTDFEYEFQLAMMNRRLEPEIETVFLMTGLRWVFLSSSILKEAAVHGGNIEGMVPEIVFHRLREKFGLE